MNARSRRSTSGWRRRTSPGSGSAISGRQLRQRVVHKHPLHLRRQVPGLFVDRDDASRVQHLFLRFRRRVRTVASSASACDDLVLRVLHLQPVGRELELAEQNDALMRAEDVVEKWLVEPDRAKRSGGVAHQHLEDLETWTAGRAHASADHLSGDRRGCRRASMTRWSEIRCDPRTGPGNDREDLLWLRGRRAGDRRPAAARRPSGTAAASGVVVIAVKEALTRHEAVAQLALCLRASVVALATARSLRCRSRRWISRIRAGSGKGRPC